MKFISPITICNKIYKKIINFYYQKRYDFLFFEKEQTYLFNKLNLDRIEGLKKIEKIKKEYNFINNPMSSEHEVIFSSISIANNKIYKILEIGTHNGGNAFLLSKLFPLANIATIDLEEENEIFKNYYNRQRIYERNEFIKKRDEILKKSKNIFFLEKNSVKLILDNSKYDLIWIDGAHGYPVVTIDIINSIKLINPDGIILCDDVWVKKPRDQDSMYNSIASYETLNILKKSNIIFFNLLYKRLDKYNNSNPKRRKFIAFIKKNSE
jgi:predicted O-methyltransferase YrrM